MAKCEICGKGVSFGQRVSHSKRHTRRTFSPNIQHTTMTVNGRKKRVSICTRCLRSQHKV